MKRKFVQTSNVTRFFKGTEDVFQRAAPEAVFMLVVGDAGLGKSATGHWWAIQHSDDIEPIFLRAKANVTPHWILSDLVRELGEPAPEHSCEKLYSQAVGLLGKRDPKRPPVLVVDEVENMIRDITVFDTLRDVTDLTETPTVLLGREHVPGKLKRHKQIWSRVSSEVRFQKLTAADVTRCCRELAEVEIADDVRAAILDQSEGRIRDVINGIRKAEADARAAKKNVVHLADVKGPLCFKPAADSGGRAAQP